MVKDPFDAALAGFRRGLTTKPGGDPEVAALGGRAAGEGGVAGADPGRAGPGGEEEDEDDGDLDVKEALGLPDQGRPMRRRGAPELAALARHAPLIAQLRRLAWWLGAGRVVTEDAELARDDAAEAAAELSLDVPRLEYLWPLALDAEFIELDEDETQAMPGEIAQAWEEGHDDEVLAIWEMVFALVIDTTLDVAAALDPSGSSELDFFGHGPLLAVMLFLARPEGLPVAEVSKAIRDGATDELPPAGAENAWQSWVGAHGDPARLLLDQMAELGAVQISDADDGPVAGLTPLGLAAIPTPLVDSGGGIPLLPATAQMTPAELIATAPGAAREGVTAETADWLAYRTAESAARELLAVAAGSDPASRLLAVGLVVTELGASPEPVCRDALGQLELRRDARAAPATLPR